MESLKAKIVKPKRRVVAKKKKTEDKEEEQRNAVENTLVEIVEKITGTTASREYIERVLETLKIDPSTPLSEADTFMIYNIFMEPSTSVTKKEGEDFVVDGEVDTKTYETTVDSIVDEIRDIIPQNRVAGLYDVLPSLKDNMINFAIEKDIFRNKPLLGKGLFKCRYCGSDNTEDYEIQTRRADEGAFVKVICRDCTKRYIIT
jgi:DNA-directed RNA polymerase subunit M/transcription elongation factor TFIIS